MSLKILSGAGLHSPQEEAGNSMRSLPKRIHWEAGWEKMVQEKEKCKASKIQA